MRTKDEIKQCINGIRERLNIDQMNYPENKPVKEGYKKAIEILKRGSMDVTGQGIERLKSIRSRAIAILAIDYLNGDTTDFVLLNIPIYFKNEEEKNKYEKVQSNTR